MLRGLWRRGSVSGRKSPGKGRSPAAARAPLSGPEREGRRLLLALHPPSAHGTSGDLRPGILARQPCHGCGTCSLNAPFLDPRGPSVHARGRDRSPEERRTRHITAAVMRLIHFRCAASHAARPGHFQRPSSLTHPLRREPGEGRRLRDGEMLIIRGEAADSSHYIYILLKCVITL